jgi:hypothetical protein
MSALLHYPPICSEGYSADADKGVYKKVPNTKKMTENEERRKPNAVGVVFEAEVVRYQT